MSAAWVLIIIINSYGSRTAAISQAYFANADMCHRAEQVVAPKVTFAKCFVMGTNGMEPGK